MSNRIRSVRVAQRRLSPAEAELWVTVEPERVTPATEVRGRLDGPRCPGRQTVELSYPLRPVPHPAPSEPGTLTARILIPEPNRWTEDAPFSYEGSVELWEGGECADRHPLVVRFR
ncbi:MAG TPA: hypothetical protein VIL46_12585 [Gemmataceae bacterium]